MHVLPIVTRGNHCPLCGTPTVRVRMPLLLRPVRQAFPKVQRRVCMSGVCGWHGFAIPTPREPGDAFMPEPQADEPAAYSIAPG
jgi:hypothetical protein